MSGLPPWDSTDATSAGSRFPFPAVTAWRMFHSTTRTGAPAAGAAVSPMPVAASPAATQTPTAQESAAAEGGGGVADGRRRACGSAARRGRKAVRAARAPAAAMTQRLPKGSGLSKWTW